MERDEFIAEIHDRLERLNSTTSSSMIKSIERWNLWLANGYGSDQWVWLRLLHRPIASLDVKGSGKLGPKFYGPFQIVEHIGDVAYWPKLPPGAKLHDVFHVDLLKQFCGEPPSETVALPPMRHGCACVEPASVLKGWLAWGKQEILVTWKGQIAADVTWMCFACSIQHSSSRTS
jgi:hypothetical protein